MRARLACFFALLNIWRVTLFVGLFFTIGTTVTRAELKITNHQDGTTLRYQVPILRGEFTTATEAVRELVVINESSKLPTRVMKGVVEGQRFLGITQLVRGENRLVLQSGKDEQRITLHWQPQTNSHLVRAIYFTDNTGDTTYQTQKANDPQDYAQKLDTALKLMQSFTAERLADQGLERRTFNLELDDKDQVKVNVVKGKLPADWYYQLPDQNLYSSIQREVDAAFPHEDKRKNLVLPAFTRFDPVTKKVKGHTALGGGNQALFGSGSLFSWPSTLNDVFSVFADSTPVNDSIVHDDSAGRSVIWGLASTTIGAALHEIGHTLNLPHTKEPMDVMTRGFDHFNRVFSLVEPMHAGNPNAFVFPDDRRATWSPISAYGLLPTRWLALDEHSWVDNQAGNEIGPNLGGWDVRSLTHKLRYVSVLDRNSNAVKFHQWPLSANVASKHFPDSELLQITNGGPFHLRAIDGQGNHFSHGPIIDDNVFVRDWNFTKTSHPWPDANTFVSLDDKQRAVLISEALSQPSTAAPKAFIDFLKQYPATQTTRAGYCVVKFRIPNETKATLLTGSDDALRVWLDDKLVVEKLVLRPAKIDEDSTKITLTAGEHTFLVEVSQAYGGWGLYFRLTDNAGKPIQIR